MASKSRLGKGLGALFPSLPGDTEDTTVAQPVDTDEKDSTAAQSDTTHRRRAGKNNVSRETSHRGGSQRAAIPSLDELSHPSDVFFEEQSVEGLNRGRRHTPATTRGRSGLDKNGAEARDSHPQTGRTEAAGQTADIETAANGTSAQSGISPDSGISSDGGASPTGGGTQAHTADRGNADAQHSPQHDQKRDSEPFDQQSGRGASEGSGEQTDLQPVMGGYLAQLNIDDIRPNAQQPRTIFDEDDLRELADSITEVGVLQPIVVRKLTVERAKGAKVSRRSVSSSGSGSRASDRSETQYELIMGERRWRASQLAGLTTIPAIVKTTGDDEMLRDALLENLHRVALNPLEEAAAYQQMIDEFGLTQAQLSKSIAKSRPQIANTLRLLNLPGSVQRRVAAGVLSAGHARALLGLGSEQTMAALADRIVAEGLSVRSTEEIVAMQSASKPAKAAKPHRESPWNGSHIQMSLEDRFDTKVSIRGSQNKGRIEIVFSSPEDMNRILELLIPGDGQAKSTEWV